MTRFYILFSLIMQSFLGIGQIIIGEEEPVKPADSKETSDNKLKTDAREKSQTAIYMVTNWSSTNRSLTENGELYGDPLAERANETALNAWSFGLGLRNQIHKNVFWDGGIAYYKNGEKYRFEDVDTMFAYQTYYTYIAMPLRINASIGEKFKWNIGVGLVPQMFSRYRQEQQWETPTNSTGDETIKAKSGYASFALSSVFNFGLTIEFKNNWALMISPEARIQLSSSYTNLAPYVHKGRAYGITFGLIRNL